MKKTTRKIAFILFCTSWQFYQAQTPTTDQNYSSTLLLSDDFNGANVDLSKWGLINGTWVNEFDFDPNMCVIQNVSSLNCLNLKATDNNTSGKQYHAGGIISNQLYSCGYYEIKCKIDAFGKFMPAFWILESSSNFAHGSCPPGLWYDEIDFFEAITGSGDVDMSSNLHYYRHSTGCVRNNGQPETFKSYIYNDVRNNFHTFGFEWTPERLICNVDGYVYRVLNTSLINTTPLKIWLNHSVQSGANSSNSTFPSNFFIDYVKVYDLKRNCIDVTIPNYNSSSYNQYEIKKSITINGTSVVYGPSTLRAQDGIEITGDFTVNPGAEFLLLPTKCY